MFVTMKLQEAERLVINALKNIYEEGEAGSIAGLAMEQVTGLASTERMLRKENVLDASQVNELQRIIERLANQEPIQYILNKCWFYGMELYVDRDVLIPRPETEELVDWVIKDIRIKAPGLLEKQYGEADETTRMKILDVGTGSGCIALALKKTIPAAEVWGCDISDRALNIARRNGSELNIRVDFQSVDYLDLAQQMHLPTVDILVSNPPYVPQKDKADMQPNVLQYEPHTALFVDNDDALLFYKAMIGFGRHRLHEKGVIYMEIHENLGEEVKKIFEEEGYAVELRKDMQGKERMVRASLAS